MKASISKQVIVGVATNPGGDNYLVRSTTKCLKCSNLDPVGGLLHVQERPGEKSPCGTNSCQKHERQGLQFCGVPAVQGSRLCIAQGLGAEGSVRALKCIEISLLLI